MNQGIGASTNASHLQSGALASLARFNFEFDIKEFAAYRYVDVLRKRARLAANSS